MARMSGWSEGGRRVIMPPRSRMAEFCQSNLRYCEERSDVAIQNLSREVILLDWLKVLPFPSTTLRSQ